MDHLLKPFIQVNKWRRTVENRTKKPTRRHVNLSRNNIILNSIVRIALCAVNKDLLHDVI